MVNFDDLIPKSPKQGINLAGKSFADLTPEERKAIRGGIGNQVGAAIVGAADAASFGLSDELSAALSSMPVEKIREQNKSIQQRNPNAYLTGQIGGAVASGLAGAGTKGGKIVINSLGKGGLGARAAKTGLLGAATSGASGFVTGSGGFENRLESAGNAALVGGGISGAIPVVGAGLSRVLSKAPKPISADEIKQLSNQAYQSAADKGGVLKGWFTNRFLDSISDVKPATVAGVRVPTDPKLDEAIEYISQLKNKRLTLDDAQALDEYLSEAVDSFTEMGQVKKSGQKLLEIQRRFRDAIESADQNLIEGGPEGFQALKEGRKLWSAQLKMRDIERIIQRAELTDNPATAIKTGFRNLLTNAKKSRGYSKEELAAIQRAASGGAAQDVLRTFGSRLWTIAGGAANGPLGAAIGQGGSMASRGLATRNAMQNAQNVAATVSQRVSPAAPKSGLPAIASSPQASSIAAPVGTVSGINSANPATPPSPLSFDDLIPQQMLQVEPLSLQTQEPSSLMGKISSAESSNNPNAKNPLSSASGLYQFTDATWKSAVDKWGRKYGIKYSDKNNLDAQAAMMNYLLQDNARILKNKGIEATDANLYFAHFLGAPAATKAINMLGNNAIAARSFPKAASANPTIFFDKQGNPRTIDEVYKIITSKVA